MDIFLTIDGIIVANGGYQRITAANTSTVLSTVAPWSMAEVVNVAAGSHTFAVRAAGVNIAGNANATVSGNNTTVLQGTLTVVILKL